MLHSHAYMAYMQQNLPNKMQKLLKTDFGIAAKYTELLKIAITCAIICKNVQVFAYFCISHLETPIYAGKYATSRLLQKM